MIPTPPGSINGEKDDIAMEPEYDPAIMPGPGQLEAESAADFLFPQGIEAIPDLESYLHEFPDHHADGKPIIAVINDIIQP